MLKRLVLIMSVGAVYGITQILATQTGGRALKKKPDYCPPTLTASQVVSISEGSPYDRKSTKNSLETDTYKLRFIYPTRDEPLNSLRNAIKAKFVDSKDDTRYVKSDWVLTDTEILGGARNEEQYLCSYENKDIKDRFRGDPKVPKLIKITSILKK